MKSITPKEYSELLIWIKDNAGFYNHRPRNKGRTIKYIESSCDTRRGDIWMIYLVQQDFRVRDDASTDYENIGDKIKAYINKEIDND